MRQKTRSPRYLLRFDDICPTMNWTVWSEIERILVERKAKPIVAVIPDNQDRSLWVEAAAEDYWERLRLWQANGWEIALHGYQHKYVTCHPGIVTVKKKSEFAGLPAAEQAVKLRRGIEILNRHGISPRVWIAPSNSFDKSTVALLSQMGISIICDGYFRFPFVCQRNVFWVPQQLFLFRPAPAGIWTVCYHHNGWSSADLHAFREDIAAYGEYICSLEEVVREWAGRRSWWSAFLCTSPRLSPLIIRAQLRIAEWGRRSITGASLAPRRISTLQTR